MSGIQEFTAWMQQQQLMDDEIRAQHEAMSNGQRRRLLLVEYHCAAKNCLLLRIWQSPHGPAFFRPAYTLTPERNLARSNEAGRANNTSDGFNRWKESAARWVSATGVKDQMGWTMNCRHVDAHVRVAEIDKDLAAAIAGQPVRRRIRSVSGSNVSLVPLESLTEK